MPSPYQQLNDAKWLRREYLERGRTAAAIATEVAARTARSTVHFVGTPSAGNRSELWLGCRRSGCGKSTRAQLGRSRTSPLSCDSGKASYVKPCWRRASGKALKARRGLVFPVSGPQPTFARSPLPAGARAARQAYPGGRPAAVLDRNSWESEK